MAQTCPEIKQLTNLSSISLAHTCAGHGLLVGRCTNYVTTTHNRCRRARTHHLLSSHAPSTRARSSKEKQNCLLAQNTINPNVVVSVVYAYRYVAALPDDHRRHHCRLAV